MSSAAIRVRELPNPKFIMKEISEQKAEPDATENLPISQFFYWLAAAQIAQILAGAGLGFFVAPASLFVSRTENEAFAWLAAAMFGYCQILLGVILIPLAIIATNSFRGDKKPRNMVGVSTAGLAILTFPLGTIFGVMTLVKFFRTSNTSFIERKKTEVQ